MIKNWLGNTKITPGKISYQPASTIYAMLPSDNIPKLHEGSLFEYLLASFSISLGPGEHIIGIPVSGQLISRLFHSVGNYTCLAPIKITIAPFAKKDEIVGQVQTQLKTIKKSFNKHYSLKNSQFPAIVFNMDNLLHDFLFATRKVAVLNLPDPFTSHQLVVNVVAEPLGLQISIKYRTGECIAEIHEVMKRFYSSIIEKENVLT